ncbi:MULTISPECIES: VOC family protein [unclassified Chryseobacterium]|uniref:VOC family protein n=1 Tax=unclassified Chryseobacterium TaxID=2593645 RepID=UPI001AE0E9E2|nr:MULTISPECIES: VOC family protein [unclassified Chryseobacterium]MBP1163821.1 putative lactoylglutathione lyase [Chryseobacterium sp. PvR013]MDR4891896.1 VOC family protein [Chryseobacterium sp. CFS7]
MKPKMIWANLAVANLERTQKFYTELGFKPNNPHTSNELVSFFMAGNEFIIHFFLKNVIENNLKSMKFGDPQSSNEIIFTLSADNKNQVDEWAEEVRNAGGTIVSEPESFGENYYGFVFADPDGHKFNVFFM